MAGWLLILTIVANTDRAGSAVTQIGPFENKEACLQAANSWVTRYPPSYTHPSALCVRQF